MSSESSEDSNTEQLRDALDSSMFHTNSDATDSKNTKEKRKSTLDDRSDQYNGLNVTPEFQAFVAKHLGKMIDNELEEYADDTPQKKKKKKCKDRIKLLSSSAVYLSASNSMPDLISNRESQCCNIDESDAAMERFGEAAVSPDWILSKESIEGWVPFEKGEVVKVKNGLYIGSEVKKIENNWCKFNENNELKDNKNENKLNFKNSVNHNFPFCSSKTKDHSHFNPDSQQRKPCKRKKHKKYDTDICLNKEKAEI